MLSEHCQANLTCAGVVILGQTSCENSQIRSLAKSCTETERQITEDGLLIFPTHFSVLFGNGHGKLTRRLLQLAW